MSRLLSRSCPARATSPLLTYVTCSSQYPGYHPKSAFPGGRVKAGWRWRMGPAFVQGFLAGVRHGFQPLLLAGVAV